MVRVDGKPIFIPTTFKTYYVESVRGNDNNNGLTIYAPKKTITAALTLIDTYGAVYVLDRGEYVEDLFMSEGTILYAPFAQLTGQITTSSCAVVYLNRHFASADDQVMVRNIGCSARTFYNCNIMAYNGYDNVICVRNEVPAGILNINVGNMRINGTGICDVDGSGAGPLINVAIEPTFFRANTTSAGDVEDLAEIRPPASSWSALIANNPFVEHNFSASAEIIVKYDLMTGRSARAPKAWQFQASDVDDLGTRWDAPVVLDTQINQTVWTNGVFRSYSFVNVTAYKYYRILITEANSPTIVQLNTVKMDAASTVGYGGDVNFDVSDALLFGEESKFVHTADEDTLVCGRFNQIHNDATATNSTAFEVDDGIVSVVGDMVDTDNVYNIAVAGALYYNCAMSVGIKAGVPTFDVNP